MNHFVNIQTKGGWCDQNAGGYRARVQFGPVHRRTSFLDIDPFFKFIALIVNTCFVMILDWVGP